MRYSFASQLQRIIWLQLLITLKRESRAQDTLQWHVLKWHCKAIRGIITLALNYHHQPWQSPRISQHFSSSMTPSQTAPSPLRRPALPSTTQVQTVQMMPSLCALVNTFLLSVTNWITFCAVHRKHQLLDVRHDRPGLFIHGLCRTDDILALVSSEEFCSNRRALKLTLHCCMYSKPEKDSRRPNYSTYTTS